MSLIVFHVSCKGFISHDCMEREKKAPLTLYFFIIIPLMIPLTAHLFKRAYM